MQYDNSNCNSCKLAHGLYPMAGGFISLGNLWMVNHYGGTDRFLGWLVMQPRQHRMALSEFTTEELYEFGIQLKRLESAFYRAWNDFLYQTDPIERVYVVLFFESGLKKDERWHIHFHVIARTKSIGEEKATDEEEKLCIKNHKGWYIIRHSPTHCKPDTSKHDKEKIEELMNKLRELLLNAP
jgi:diadenosine tetraphosphate (Ap4A) HIT family hydrolase